MINRPEFMLMNMQPTTPDTPMPDLYHEDPLFIQWKQEHSAKI